MEKEKDIIDQYLTNKLSGTEKEAFEAELTTNENLRSETELQSALIETIKKARIQELKASLNKVKIEPVPFLSTPTKITAGIIIIGLIAFFFYPFSSVEKLSEPQVTNEIKPNISVNPIEKAVVETQTPVKDKDQRKANTVTPVTKPATVAPPKADVIKPSIKVVDPTEQFEYTQEEPILIKSDRDYVSLAKIEVENDETDKKHTFHYKFHKGKLILYGTFDSSLYEILEINGNKKTVFLYYNEKFYLLDENQAKIKLLEPIQDSALIQKLSEYRVTKK